MTALGAAGVARRWAATAVDAAATDLLGRALGRTAPEGAVILLEGALGAGKTRFAQGVARGCGVSDPVTSPTYNLILHYAGRRPFTHVDLYRLATPEELATLDLEEIAAADGVTCVEWPELVRGRIGEPYADVAIEHAPAPGAPERRRLTGSLVGPDWAPALAALQGAGAEEVAP